MKKCSKCRFSKPLSEFNKDKGKKDGLQGYCRDCSNKNSKQFRGDNPEYQKNWQGDNPEYNNQWKENNPEYYKEHNKQWREKNKKRLQESKQDMKEIN